QRGATRWTLPSNDRAREPFRSSFSACVRVTLGEGSAFRVRAVTRADSAWNSAEEAQRASPTGTPPQSHWVNARTNPEWEVRRGTNVVRGRVEWVSEESATVFRVAGGNG